MTRGRLALLCAAALLLAVGAASLRGRGERGNGAAVAPASTAAAPAQGATSALAPLVAPPPAGSSAVRSGPAPAPAATTAPAGDPGSARAPIDLARLRRALPGNLYFALDAPTTDPEVLRERAADAQRWADLYGKILSGTGTEQEVRDYFEQRRRVSSDYRDFALKALELQGDALGERDRGLLELSARMHQDRLAEVDGKLAEALARKREQDQRRAEWERAGKPQ